MTALIGYARVSKADGSQVIDLQRDALAKAGVDLDHHLYTDAASGKRDDRPGLDACIKALRHGDTLVVWKLDRLGRDLRHLVNLVGDLTKRGIGLKVLAGEGVNARVVSAPCLEWFAEQDEAYRAEVLPDGPDAPVRVSVEAGIAMPWFEHTVTASSPGARVSLEHYGESADGARLMEKYGFTGEHVAEVTRGLL